jgi:hypothetical protein
MKRVYLLLAALLYLTSTSHCQNLLIANNNPSAPTGAIPNTVFTGANALQNAVAAAAPGDIVYVIPSSTNYGNVVIDTALTLFGVGIRPQRDLSVLSKIGNITVEGSNVRISGFGEMSSITLASWNNLVPANILIENNRLINGIGTLAATGVGIGNLIIRNNIIESSSFLGLFDRAPGALITNNVFIGGTAYSGGLTCSNVTLSYNIFANLGDADIFDRVSNCLFDHNIFYGVRVDIGNIDPTFGDANTWNYNLAYGNSVASYNVFEVTNNFNNGTGNLESTGTGILDPLFVNFPLTNTWNQSYDFTLQNGSPAISVSGSLDGWNIGPSGGDPPFDFDGNLLPYIQSITMPTTIPVGNDLPVNIKAKGN